MWWAEYTKQGGYQVTAEHIVKADHKPGPHYWGPFHCQACADLIANFGKTSEQAFEFNHGTDDQKFGAFLSC